MPDEDLAKKILTWAEGQGVSFVEARIEDAKEETVLLKNGEVDAVGHSSAHGAGIRVLYGGALGFSSTNDLREESLRDTLRAAIAMAKAASSRARNPIKLAKTAAARTSWASRFTQDPFEVSLEEKISTLLEADRSVPSGDVSFPARMFSLGFSRKRKLLMNSFGDQVEGDSLRTEGFVFLTAFNPQRGSVQKFDQLGESRGWEAIKNWDLPSRTNNLANALSLNLMKGVEVEPGVMDVILGSEVSGIVVHESAGHPAEADRIMGREAAQAGESYLRPNSLGYRVGSEEVNVIDDPTIPGSYGYYLYDDEGIRARPRLLIKEGRINEFLHNRETSAALGTEPNGAARASAFDREPMVRMANTYFAPGDRSFDELLADIREGVYIKSFMEWNIDDVRWNERYVGLEAFRIVNGELREPVRSPVLEITTGKLFSSVDAVGKELNFTAATCGKGEPEQGVPVWTGGPEVRLRGVRVSKR